MKFSKLSNAKTKYIFVGTSIFLFILLISVIGLKTYVKVQANTFAEQAEEIFQIGKTEALLVMIETENYSLDERNKAIWALGVLEAEEALPKLQALYTGVDCNHKAGLCQYEIEKAIKKIK